MALIKKIKLDVRLYIEKTGVISLW